MRWTGLYLLRWTMKDRDGTVPMRQSMRMEVTWPAGFEFRPDFFCPAAKKGHSIEFRCPHRQSGWTQGGPVRHISFKRAHFKALSARGLRRCCLQVTIPQVVYQNFTPSGVECFKALGSIMSHNFLTWKLTKVCRLQGISLLVFQTHLKVGNE